MFGLKYFTKVCSLFGDNFAATGELFSNPMMLMTLISGEGNMDLSKLMLFSSLSKGEGFNNPMLMSMLLKDDSKSDLSTFAMMSMLGNGTNPFAPKKEAKKRVMITGYAVKSPESGEKVWDYIQIYDHLY